QGGDRADPGDVAFAADQRAQRGGLGGDRRDRDLHALLTVEAVLGRPVEVMAGRIRRRRPEQQGEAAQPPGAGATGEPAQHGRRGEESGGAADEGAPVHAQSSRTMARTGEASTPIILSGNATRVTRSFRIWSRFLRYGRVTMPASCSLRAV